MCSLRSFEAKNSPKTKSFSTSQCRGAKVRSGIGFLAITRRFVDWTGNGKILLATLPCKIPNSRISNKTFSPRRARRARRKIGQFVIIQYFVSFALFVVKIGLRLAALRRRAFALRFSRFCGFVPVKS